MEVNYNIFWVSDMSALGKHWSLRGYSKLRKAGLISLLRSHYVSTQMFTKERGQFDPEESDNEVDYPSYGPTIMAQKQFDPEESDNEVDPPSNRQRLQKEGHSSIQKNRIAKSKQEVMI